MLNGERLYKRFTKEFLQRLQNNDEDLTELDLSGKEIGDEGIIELAKYLADNCTIEYLNLYCNEIGDESAFALAKMLERNKTLTSLDLGLNEIRSAGAKAIFKALESNKTLTRLECGMEVGDAATKALGKMLVKNSTLTDLSFDFEELGKQARAVLADGLSRNKRLRYLKLLVTPLDEVIYDNYVKMVSEALWHNKTLKVLHFWCTDTGGEDLEISPSVGKAFAKAIKNNYVLEKLEMDYFPVFDDKVYKDIRTSLARNKVLNRDVCLAACQMLRGVRLTRMKMSYQVGGVLEELPLKLQSHIMSKLDKENVLSNQQKSDIIKFALDKSTLGRTRMEFFKQTNCLHYEKPEAENYSLQNEPPNKKPKLC